MDYLHSMVKNFTVYDWLLTALTLLLLPITLPLAGLKRVLYGPPPPKPTTPWWEGIPDEDMFLTSNRPKK